MGWNNALQYLHKVAVKSGVTTASDTTADAGLPFRARIGSTVALQVAPFLSAVFAGSLIRVPSGNQIIQAIGRLKLDFPGKIYRYYLETGDRKAKVAFLQIVTNEEGEVTEAMYCTQVSRFVPESEEEQDNFMGTAGVGLGEKRYSFYADQLDGTYTPTQITSIFRGEPAIEYTRESGRADIDWIAPFQGVEVRIDDVTGEHGLSKDIWFVPYVRSLDDQLQETMLITTEFVTSRDGDDAVRNLHVNFVVGIPIEISRINIL